MQAPITKQALIFGVSGQDGAYLARFLLDKGYRVFGTSRDAQSASFANLRALGIQDAVQTLSANPADFRSVLVAITKAQPHEIYNLSGQSSVGLSFEQPVDTFSSMGTANLTLLEAIRFLGGKIRYYNAGSSECFGNTPEPATEATPFHPRSPYAVGKAAAFWQVANYREAYGLFACSGILFNHESPLRTERFVTQKIVRAACRIAAGAKETLSLGNIDIARDWGWAPDYVEAMWAMLQSETADDYIIATGRTCSLREFVATVFKCCSLHWEEHVQQNRAAMRPSDITTSSANPEKAARLLCWRAKHEAEDVARLLVEAEQARVAC
ncbi:MAG: GDP-mannose 4,6-dehydratase [Proteobacteria bacterium]|nr:GDP-mannose 4,6-dehydratase [Cystobacterineae bacterium]MCL2258456.1 GDP-mannose 4,6-dehydratase [Cystobacterineae bacterium]MCL2315205.1 GDP-mannose 4,6-dehydratase [Pseudomonadota bacterium]